MSDSALYLIGSKKGPIKYPLRDLRYIIKSNKSNEIAFHFERYMLMPNTPN